jgi:hypothetical protein
MPACNPQFLHLSASQCAVVFGQAAHEGSLVDRGDT